MNGAEATTRFAPDASPAADDGIVLEAVRLSKTFPVGGKGRRGGRKRARLHALSDVSLTLRSGEITALIGESGSGKSTLARVLARLEQQSEGVVRLRGKEVDTRGRSRFLRYVRDVQMVFQDPFSSLNPMKSVEDHVARPLRIHGRASSGAEAQQMVQDLLREVQLTPTKQVAAKFPHELSGGQRQRVAIARALAVQPTVLLADEPVSMLDVSMRLGVLNLLRQIVVERSVALLYITHDIASARYFAKRGVVMYAGHVVEEGPCEEITQSPAHPYTQLLISSAPQVGADGARAEVRGGGEPPKVIDPGPGCRFASRCPFVMERCRTETPPMFPIATGRTSRCWLHEESAVASATPDPHHETRPSTSTATQREDQA
ncbi:ABC transporter ATP-binding protein [Leifsonia sp. L25]|uniref:ABC transporter ATP-binding protein n=1 Tax=Actinomycetes TaxID=1760 RepID=UPI003D693D9F